ncbi:ABC transporter ATP-binding protein [Mycolicibacterium madagascariense]|uniref:ABC transporter ATP-binding protein n=1 Tax=Mycolicibacterium madagascariense TaxID=212765 RepID=A0A7I7XJJ5_9MYCO|nr:sugar ABC transporter ATP-binding protein [Mycolicibacterium madagascariense]MCV7015896.1 sugar ABC transporter ATP-binding protein [Mycolicibacterium madagascariense]BBZ29371.1 ABC transporter ATP-binding protein [Mycolicibacterium madagascariense]
MSTPTTEPRLQATGIVKTFGNNRALKGVDLVVGDGEVLGLIGENGAGKSTILNIVSGVLPYDSGSLRLDGREIAPKTYQDANRLGIFRVFQDAALIDSLAVYENAFFGWEHLFRSRTGGLDRRRLKRITEEALHTAGVDGIDVTLSTGALTPGQKQSVDIARVTALAELLEVERPVVLFDEPTTALDQEHEDNFLRLLQRLRGVAAVVFVSHRLPEILQTTDRITVFKDGESVGHRPTAGTDEGELHRLMVGRVRTQNYYREQAQRDVAADTPPRLVVDRVAGAGVLADASLEVAPGEIVGLAGTEGSGKRVLGEIIAGVVRPTEGRVLVNGEEVSGSVGDHVRAGIAYVPPDRSEKGLITSASLVENVQLASLHDRFATKRVGLWAVGLARKATERYVTELGIVAEGIDAPVSSLSGGNAQKVLIAKWLLRQPQVLILDEPTQGVDTGAREGIYDLLRQVAAAGTAVILVSDDLPELIGLSNRIVVITNGRISATVDAPPGAKPDEHDLVARMIPGATRPTVPTTVG